MKKYMTNEKAGISYTLIGDYYFPNLVLPGTDDSPIGRFGRQWLQHLKEYRNILYTQLLTQGKLNRHLHEIDDQAQELYDRLVRQYAAAQGVNESLKGENQIDWVGHMNNIRSATEEVVRAEIIYL